MFFIIIGRNIIKNKVKFAIVLLQETNAPPSLVSRSIFNMAATLQIPRVFPRVSYHESAKATQFPHPGLKIGDQSWQIPPHARVCPRGHPPGWPLISALRKLEGIQGKAL